MSILTKRLYSPREYTYFGTIPTHYGEYTNYGRYDFFRLQRNGVALFGRPKRPTAGAEGPRRSEGNLETRLTRDLSDGTLGPAVSPSAFAVGVR